MIRYFRAVFILALLLFRAEGVSAAIEYREVVVQGSGTTMKTAVMDALAEAIARVNGMVVDSRKSLDAVEVRTADRNRSDYFSSDTFRNAVTTATKGVVAGYTVLNQQQEPSGTWRVGMSCKVAVYQKDPIADRKRIAVFPMRLSGKPFVIDGLAVDAEASNRIFGQSLVSSLVQSRRFTVLDRDYISETIDERQLIVDGSTPVEQMVRLGQELTADYILVGTLEEVALSLTEAPMRLSGRTVPVRNGRVEASYRIIDIDTRQVLYADFARVNVGEAELRKETAAAATGGLESVLCRVAADAIGRKILNAIYPVLVVGTASGELILGQGGAGVKVGDRFDVFEYGEAMFDPYTKENIGRQEIHVATVEVVRVNPKQSIAKVLKSGKDIAASFQPKKFVCREVRVDKKALAEEQRQKRAVERANAFEADW